MEEKRGSYDVKVYLLKVWWTLFNNVKDMPVKGWLPFVKGFVKDCLLKVRLLLVKGNVKDVLVIDEATFFNKLTLHFCQERERETYA